MKEMPPLLLTLLLLFLSETARELLLLLLLLPLENTKEEELKLKAFGTPLPPPRLGLHKISLRNPPSYPLSLVEWFLGRYPCYS
jgi:hypothetical protein